MTFPMFSTRTFVHTIPAGFLLAGLLLRGRARI